MGKNIVSKFFENELRKKKIVVFIASCSHLSFSSDGDPNDRSKNSPNRDHREKLDSFKCNFLMNEWVRSWTVMPLQQRPLSSGLSSPSQTCGWTGCSGYKRITFSRTFIKWLLFHFFLASLSVSSDHFLSQTNLHINSIPLGSIVGRFTKTSPSFCLSLSIFFSNGFSRFLSVFFNLFHLYLYLGYPSIQTPRYGVMDNV